MASTANFISQSFDKTKKILVGFEEDKETKENLFTQEEHTHLTLNIEENFHYYGCAADKDSISSCVGLFHPYNPDQDCLPRTMGFPETPIAFQIPIEYKENLPIKIRELLNEHKATKVIIRPFFQNMPWIRNSPLLIRPHHVLIVPNTEEEKVKFITGQFGGSAQCKVGLFFINNEDNENSKDKENKENKPIDISDNLNIEENKLPIFRNTNTNQDVNNSGNNLSNLNIDRAPSNTLSPHILHLTSHSSNTGYTLCSPAGPGIIYNIDYTKTYAFYSVIVTLINNNITENSIWHISPVCLLNQEDNKRILEIISFETVGSILDLIKILDKENFAMANILKELLDIKSLE